MSNYICESVAMRIYKDGACIVAFGNKSTAIIPDHPLATELALIKDRIGLEELAMVHQVHGTEGIIVDAKPLDTPPDADFMVTSRYFTGLAIKTADCLPIILYDTKNHVVGIAHAGWRGTVQGIVTRMYHTMAKHYHTNTTDLAAYFGPSIGACCYTVTPDFAHEYRAAPWFAPSWKERNGAYYFDLVSANQLQLISLGVNPTAIHTAYWHCTACSEEDCSYRREPQSPLRQLTIVALG